MEVVLKKTKLSNPILKQALRSTQKDLEIGTVLGWCIHAKIKTIVIYREDLPSISVFPLFQSVEAKEIIKDEVLTYYITVRLGGSWVPFKYTSNTEEDKDNFLKVLNSVKEKAESLGQFFL